MSYLLTLIILAVLFVVAQTFVRKHRDRLMKVNPYLQAVIFVGGLLLGVIVAALFSIPPEYVYVVGGIVSFMAMTYLVFLFVEYVRMKRGRM